MAVVTEDELVAELVQALHHVNGMVAAVAARGLHCQVDLVDVNTMQATMPPLITVIVERRDRLYGGRVG